MNLEDDQNLRESVNRGLYVIRFTVHSEPKKTPFELHFGRKPRTKLSNLKKSIPVDSKDLYYPKLSRTNHGPFGNVKEKDDRTKIQRRDDIFANKESEQFGKYK